MMEGRVIMKKKIKDGMCIPTVVFLFQWLLLLRRCQCQGLARSSSEADGYWRNVSWPSSSAVSAQSGRHVVYGPGTLMVPITLIPSAVPQGAVCLDGTPPAYHLHRGFGSGANSWLIQLEGGGWCNDIRSCVFRKTTRRGSSNYMEKILAFTGILSNKPEENPDFFNWNRVKVRYCDGASFSGEGYNKDAGLFFRGQRIWLAAMKELMSKGMSSASQAILSGCSAGGLSSILHCDEFGSLFRGSTKVKCLGDAGLFLDVVDIAGSHALKSFFNGVVTLQGAASNLPRTCTSRMDATSCFFPQNIIANIRTPLFLLNSAYDLWQIIEAVAPKSADVLGNWAACTKNHLSCDSSQLGTLQGFRNQMINVLSGFSTSRKNGLFINSCFAHCQSELQDTWFAENSPLLRETKIAVAVGDWFFDRAVIKEIDCPYPCDKSCHHLN